MAGEELLDSLVDELMDSFARSGKKPNYVYLRSLIQRFIENNPDVDPMRVDWVGVWDDKAGDFDEVVTIFKKAYPMYKWGTPTEEVVSEERWRSEVKSAILEQLRELSPDDIAEIVEKARELAGLAGPSQQSRQYHPDSAP